jgi:hypothetical protein
LDGGPIRSLTLDSLAGNNYSGLNAERYNWNYVACFLEGTLIETVNGPRAIEDLQLAI